MLSENTKIDKIEVLENGTLQVRTADIILRDGAEINRSYHRHVLAPGDDLTNQDAKVQAIANATWTPCVLDAYAASQSQGV